MSLFCFVACLFVCFCSMLFCLLTWWVGWLIITNCYFIYLILRPFFILLIYFLSCRFDFSGVLLVSRDSFRCIVVVQAFFLYVLYTFRFGLLFFVFILVSLWFNYSDAGDGVGVLCCVVLCCVACVVCFAVVGKHWL